MKIIAVINQKGGVGKTTTAVNLGAGLALCGRRVLLIDLDPQANLSSHLESKPYPHGASAYELLRSGNRLQDLIVPTTLAGLDVVPGGADLAAAELELAGEIGRESILRNQVERARREGLTYDYILIDCPPSLGLLAVNALTAADEALVPIQAEFFALAGMARFIEVHSLVQDRLNPALQLSGIVICMWRGQANLSREVRDDVRGTFGDVLYETMIRQNVKLAEAPSQGRTIFEYAPESNGAADYASLTREFLARHDDRAEGEANLESAVEAAYYAAANPSPASAAEASAAAVDDGARMGEGADAAAPEAEAKGRDGASAAAPVPEVQSDAGGGGAPSIPRFSQRPMPQPADETGDLQAPEPQAPAGPTFQGDMVEVLGGGNGTGAMDAPRPQVDTDRSVPSP